MILKNNSEKVIKLVRYYETLEFADKLKLAINIFESDYIKIKSNKMLDLLKQILKIVNANYSKYGMINFLEYRHLLLMSAPSFDITNIVDGILNNNKKQDFNPTSYWSSYENFRKNLH